MLHAETKTPREAWIARSAMGECSQARRRMKQDKGDRKLGAKTQCKG